MRVAILTSGGDSPGMNAAIRAAVRAAKWRKWSVFGIMRGYQGLINQEIEELTARSVSNIVQHGGTILKTSRSKDFTTQEGLEKALKALDDHKIDALITIGGNGTIKGAYALSEIWQGKIIGIPGTIDNDIYGTDFTIGFDTAVNTAMEAIDKIRDTADAHDRIFIVEVMGRDAGFIALDVGIAGGAEEILLPERYEDIHEIANRFKKDKARGKLSCILVSAEGNAEGGAFEIEKKLHEIAESECRVVVLGYIQRGGTPTARDRILATKLGAFAIDSLEQGFHEIMVGEIRGDLARTSFEEVHTRKKDLDPYLLQLIPILAS